jgi:hypothetical protein
MEAVFSDQQTIDNAQDMLMFLPEAFHLFPQPDEQKDPEPEEWSKYLLEYPQYADSKYGLAALTFAQSRESVEGLIPELQALAASLICVFFDEQELREIANI